MIRVRHSLSLTAVLGLGLILISPASSEAGGWKRDRCAPAPAIGCQVKPVKVKMPKLGHGCGLQLPKLGLGKHRKATCETVVPATHAPAMVVPAPQMPMGQQGMMPGYAAPELMVPSAPGMVPGYGVPPAPGVGLPPMPGGGLPAY